MDAFVTPIGGVAQATTASRPPALVSRGECRRLSGPAPVVKQKLIAVPLAGPDRRLWGTKTRRAAILGRMAARSWCSKRKRVVAGQVKLRSVKLGPGQVRSVEAKASRRESRSNEELLLEAANQGKRRQRRREASPGLSGGGQPRTAAAHSGVSWLSGHRAASVPTGQASGAPTAAARAAPRNTWSFTRVSASSRRRSCVAPRHRCHDGR